jgi:hypothetical protein
MPVVPYYLGRPAQAWIAAMSGPARATTQNSCAATSLATGTFPASPRPAVPTAPPKTQEEASPRSMRELIARMGHASTRAALVHLHDTNDRQRAIATVISDLARPELAQPSASSEGTSENATGT